MLSELIDFCKNKTVCIVGPAELNINMSELIDSHDIVVRMNNYQKLSNAYGNKKTIFFGEHCYNYNDFQYAIFLKSFFGLRENQEDKMHKANKYFKNTIFLTPNSGDDEEFLKEIHFEKKYNYTTGGFAIMVFLEIIDHIKSLNIIGISFGLTPYNISYKEYDELYYLGNKNFDYFNNPVGNSHHYGEDFQFVLNNINSLNDTNKEKIAFENKELVEHMKKCNK